MRKIETKIMDAAFEWRAIMDDDCATATDRQVFHAWLKAHPLHEEAYERASMFWQDLGGLQRDDLDDSFFQPSCMERFRSTGWGAHGALKDCIRKNPVPIAGGFVAACALLLAVLFVPGSQLDTAPRAHAYATRIGEIRTVDLEDGSHITLGAATSIEVAMTTNGRRVTMGPGEAFFQVAKDAARPFVVTSGDLQVTVHGTAFDVRRNSLSAHVAVTEGVVSVAYPLTPEPSDPSADSGASRPDSLGDTVLVAGEKITLPITMTTATNADAIAPVRIATVKPETVGAWRNNHLVYIDAPLSEIVADINRYQTRTIRISDATIAAIKVTATFNSNDIDDMLQTLTEVFPVRLETSPQGLVLHHSR